MSNLDSIFKAFGGAAKLAAALGHDLSATAGFLRREGIPVRFWAPLVAAAKAQGHDWITPELLAEIHARPKAARRAPPGERHVGRHGGRRGKSKRGAAAEPAAARSEEVTSMAVAALVDAAVSRREHGRYRHWRKRQRWG